MSVARADGLCFQHAGNVYVFGGRCQLKLSKKIDVYSIEDNQWHLLRVDFTQFSSKCTVGFNVLWCSRRLPMKCSS